MNWFKQSGFRWLRWLVAISCFVFLGYRFRNSGGELTTALDVFLLRENLLLLSAIAVMVVLNWGIEALKWMLGVLLIEKISFRKSFSSVLAGLAVSMLGPNRTGEFLGRITALSPGNRVAGSFLSVHVSLAQTLVTLIAGLGAMLLADPKYLPFQVSTVFLVIAVAIICAGLVLIYYRFSLVYKWLLRLPVSRWVGNPALQQVTLGNGPLTVNLILSVLRYAVFSTQFVILLQLAGTPLCIPGTYWLVAFIYLIMTAVPSFALAELGIRGTVSVYLAGLFAIDPGPVVIASSVLWLLNVAVPAAVGASLLAIRRE